MEQIVIQVKNKSKARALINFLKSLEFVENISTSNLPLAQVDPAAEKENDFFALAGLWADRDISLETLRQKAWPGRV
jgi:hypothetical protein